jgi:predicted ATP-grasp superfamily ATP-dependent carboligase
MGNERIFRLLDNKEELSRLTRELNLPVPRHYRLEDAIDRFPLVFKPAESSSAHGVEYIHNAEELDALRAHHDGGSYVLQEYVKGFGAGYSVLAREGKVLAGCGHRRRAEWPVTGGSSMIRSYFEHPEMERIASRVIEHTGWSGVAMFEFKVTPDNQVRLIEVNPRMWGSLYQSIASGVNFPLLLFRPELANSIMLKKNTITYYSPHHLRSLVYYILRQRDFGPLAFFLSNAFRAKADVSPVGDPGGYLSLLYRFVHRPRAFGAGRS